MKAFRETAAFSSRLPEPILRNLYKDLTIVLYITVNHAVMESGWFVLPPPHMYIRIRIPYATKDECSTEPMFLVFRLRQNPEPDQRG